MKNKYLAGLTQGALLTVVLVAGIAAGSSNLGFLSSLLNDPSNPIGDAETRIHFPGVTEIAGAGSTALQSVATTSATAGALITFNHATSGADLHYRLVNSPAAEDIPWVVRPNDYNVSTNDKGWVLERVFKDGVEAVWNETDTTKFHQLFVGQTADGTKLLKVDSTGFTLTD